MNNRLGLLLGLATAGVLVQQQILLRLPPRLVQLRHQHIHSGSAGLDLYFSRPMDLNTVKAEIDLKPALRHRWLGNHGALRLILKLDPIRRRLLLTLSRKGQNTANPAFIDSATLQWEKIISIDVEEAQLLNP